MSHRLLVAALMLIAGSIFARPSSAQQADVIRGRVIDTDSVALENVVVTATSVSGNVTRTARTDRNGRFTVTFPGGDGDYMVTFASLGFAARRFQVKRAADEDILVADARLTRIGAILDPVQVTAQRERVQRGEISPDVSGTGQQLTDPAVPVDLLGDLAAMAASLPGVQSVPGADGGADGYSVLGLGADQNNTTLDGMQFGGSSMPRDALVGSSLITSPYDVSRGGFSGAQMALRTRSGSNFVTRGMSANVDAPQLQWSDRTARSLGQEYSNLSIGGRASGPLSFDKAFYNVSYQLGRRASDLQTLLNTEASALETAGVSSDSVARFLSILQRAGVPLSVGPVADSRIGDQGSLFGNFDFAPPSSSSGQAFSLAFNGNWSRQSPAGGLVTELPARSGERTGWRGSVQGRHNTYVRNTVLSETSVGASTSRSAASPYLQLPSGFVRVNSSFPDGASSLQNLLFGGSPSLNNASGTTTINLLNQLSWFSTNNKHRVKLATELRHDAASQEQANNLLGTFAFNSLADLDASRPSSFTRQLSARDRDLSQITVGISVGDSYRRTRNLQIQYGLRVDANRYLVDPVRNDQLQSLFGTVNDEVPDGLYVSPRIGFSWTYGYAAQVSSFVGAARVPRAVLRGGIGIFQNTPSTNLIGSSIDNTGLPGGVQQLTCVGGATPFPDWNAYASDNSRVPDLCADGTMGSIFSNSAPNVSLFAADFSAPRSVRSNLQWSGPSVGNRFSTQIEATWSVNTSQQSFVDLNFTPVQRFALASENDRPVFVNPGSIVAASGAIASRDARVSSAFSRVTQLRSDLRSRSAQLRLGLSPVSFSSSFSWSASYVYSSVREQTRGFNSTAGNPLAVEWARSPFDSRHQLVYNVGYNFFDFVRVNWFGNFRSGNPFTPMIAGDVNGDGYSNDRAFVFDPANTADPAVASAMQSLLETGSDAARSCLSRQLARLAARNACQGPWSSSASMSVSFNPVKVRMPRRATLSFQLSNPLGAADRLVNGPKSLRGWGQPAFPDQALLYVRGFDPASASYRYEVNQRFGTTNQALGGLRVPVSLTALLRFDIGPTRERQLLSQQLDRGRTRPGTRVSEALLKAIYGSGGIANPMAAILRQQDSLRLTGVQADSIAAINRLYVIRTDAIWSPIAKTFGELGNAYNADVAYDRYIDARKATVDLLTSFAPSVKRLLTAEQQRKLPPSVASALDTRYLASIRSGTASFTSNPAFSGGGPVFAGSDFTLPAGAGGGTIVIIKQ
ncbi:MAG: carboxypeptidase regulatory-like domain-containing protein [Gemmatimonadaceae bacterium]